MESIAIDVQAGIAAARAGNQAEARNCFIRALKYQPRNEDVWLRLSSVMPTVEQSLRCIEHLLSINPNNGKAQDAREILRVRLLLEEAAVIRTPAPPISTPQRRYMLGEALVEARIITTQQLETALAEQRKLARKRKPMRLGEILLRLKLVTPTQLEAAVAAQIETLSPRSDTGTMGNVGAYLIQQGLVTRAQLHQGLARQAELKRQGRSIMLGDVLVTCGYLSREQLNHAMVEWQHQYNDAFR